MLPLSRCSLDFGDIRLDMANCNDVISLAREPEALEALAGYSAAAAGPDNRLFFGAIEPLAFYKPCSRTGTALCVIIGAMPCRFLHGL
jgi:hypothetical protein